jgi:hypothetical protein
MSYCSNCGKELPSDASGLCADCTQAATSAPLTAAEITKKMNHGRQMPADAPAGLNRRAFNKTYSEGARSCTGAAIIGYISAGATLLVALSGMLDGSIYMLIDVAIVLVCTLLVHLLKSRIAAILLFAYGMFNFISYLVDSGEFRGWLIAAAGIVAIIGAFKCAKEWRQYQERTASVTE